MKGKDERIIRMKIMVKKDTTQRRMKGREDFKPLSELISSWSTRLGTDGRIEWV